MATHWLDNGPEGWYVPAMLDVSDEFCMPDAGEHGEHAFVCTPWRTLWRALPDRVRLPAELGGQELLVLGEYALAEGIVTCVNCGNAGAKPMLALEQHYGVARCQACTQYNWFQQKEEVVP